MLNMYAFMNYNLQHGLQIKLKLAIYKIIIETECFCLNLGNESYKRLMSIITSSLSNKIYGI